MERCQKVGVSLCSHIISRTPKKRSFCNLPHVVVIANTQGSRLSDIWISFGLLLFILCNLTAASAHDFMGLVNCT